MLIIYNTAKRFIIFCIPLFFVSGLLPVYAYGPDGHIDYPFVAEENSKTPPLNYESSGNPINTITGNKHQTETDYESSNLSTFLFRRVSSTASTYWETPREPVLLARMGKTWRHNYSAKIKLINTTAALAIRADGRKLQFTETNGVWESDADINDTLSSLVDIDNNVIGWQLITTDNKTELYDADGKLLSITLLNGQTVTLEYDVALNMGGDDDSNTVDKITDPFGRRILLTHIDDRIRAMTDPADNIYLYDYDVNDNLSSVTYPDQTPMNTSDNPSRIYHYENIDFPNHLTGITDENENRFATWAYDDEGRAILSKHAGGADRVDLVYNEDDTITVTQGTGQAQTYHTENILGVKRVIQIDGGPCESCNGQNQSKTYDANGFVASRTDFNGNVTSYINDSRGLQTSRTEAAGTSEERTITTEWHTDFRLPIKITEPGRITEFSYNAQGQQVSRKMIAPDSNEVFTLNTYNALGLIETIDGPRVDVNDITTFEYNVQGNLSKTTNALFQETKITNYNVHGQPLTIVDVNDTITTLAYDARRRLLTRTVDGQTTTFERDSVGNITKTTLPNGSFLVNEYDDAQRLIAVEDNLSNRIEYLLDRQGNIVRESVKDQQGTLTRTMRRNYNELNRLIEIIGGENQSTAFAYDTNGNQTAITVDATGLNQQTSQAFDALNRLSNTTDANNGITTFTYDSRDNLTSVTDAKGLTTTYTYDAFDNLTQQTSPDTGVTTFSYDEAGNRKSQTDARGVTSNYTYDVLNRLTLIDYSDDTQDVNYGYDICMNGVGGLCLMLDENGYTLYTYDARGNLTSQTTTIDDIVKTTSFAYNGVNQLTQTTYPSGRTVDNIRNGLGQISDVTTTQGTTDTISSTMSYEPFGPMNSMVYGNNLVQSRSYDQDYRLTQLITINGNIQQDLSYVYDAANNITDIANVIDNNRSQSLGYDELNRLLAAASNYGDIDYTYDAIGNRLNETVDTVIDTYSYDTNSHHLTQIVNGETTTFTYDANGNTTSNTAFDFTYGDNNRLKDAKIGSSTLATYIYNGRGERVKKDGASIIYYYYDQGGQLIAELDDLGNTLVEYIYIDGQPVSIITGGSINFIHNDHLGTPQQITDGTQAIVWKADYTSFGEATITTELITNNLRFPGQYYDEETNLHYNYFRYYDPQLGRYITSDPIGLRAGSNTYLYVGANPFKWIDYFGLAYTAGQTGQTWDEFQKNNASGFKDPCGCFAKAFLGWEDLSIGGLAGATHAATGPYGTKPRTGAAGGGPSKDRTSWVSTKIHQYNIKYGKTAATAAMRKAGKAISWGSLAVGGALLIYDTVIFGICINECNECKK